MNRGAAMGSADSFATPFLNGTETSVKKQQFRRLATLGKSEWKKEFEKKIRNNSLKKLYFWKNTKNVSYLYPRRLPKTDLNLWRHQCGNLPIIQLLFDRVKKKVGYRWRHWWQHQDLAVVACRSRKSLKKWKRNNKQRESQTQAYIYIKKEIKAVLNASLLQSFARIIF